MDKKTPLTKLDLIKDMILDNYYLTEEDFNKRNRSFDTLVKILKRKDEEFNIELIKKDIHLKTPKDFTLLKYFISNGEYDDILNNRIFVYDIIPSRYYSALQIDELLNMKKKFFIRSLAKKKILNTIDNFNIIAIDDKTKGYRGSYLISILNDVLPIDRYVSNDGKKLYTRFALVLERIFNSLPNNDFLKSFIDNTSKTGPVLNIFNVKIKLLKRRIGRKETYYIPNDKIATLKRASKNYSLIPFGKDKYDKSHSNGIKHIEYTTNPLYLSNIKLFDTILFNGKSICNRIAHKDDILKLYESTKDILNIKTYKGLINATIDLLVKTINDNNTVPLNNIASLTKPFKGIREYQFKSVNIDDRRSIMIKLLRKELDNI